LNYVQLRASGKFSVRVTDPRLFITEIVGTQGKYTTMEIEDYLRDEIVSRLNTVLGKNLKTVFELGQFYAQIETATKAEVTDFFNAMGIELTDMIIVGIVPPDEVQEKINERSSMAAVGNLDAYMKFKTAQAMEKAAESEGGAGTAGLGVGLGAGMTMANMMMSSMGQQKQGEQKKESSEDVLATIEKLSKLKEAGAITEEEFQAKKKELLSKL
jgi:membrane protease subunit (stomatin/prohibitin family)